MAVATTRFHGRVFSGSGRGAYYVGHPGFAARFMALLGYIPFPGTLNLRLEAQDEIDKRAELGLVEGNSTEAFTYDGKEFSSVKCFGGTMLGHPIALTIPRISEYDDTVLEIIAPVKLRDTLRLRDGWTVEVLVGTDLLVREDGHRNPVSV